MPAPPNTACAHRWAVSCSQQWLPWYRVNASRDLMRKASHLQGKLIEKVRALPVHMKHWALSLPLNMEGRWQSYKAKLASRQHGIGEQKHWAIFSSTKQRERERDHYGDTFTRWDGCIHAQSHVVGMATFHLLAIHFMHRIQEFLMAPNLCLIFM